MSLNVYSSIMLEVLFDYYVFKSTLFVLPVFDAMLPDTLPMFDSSFLKIII